jgi:hypothetical protein
VDRDDAIAPVSKGQGAKQERVHQAEDGDVGADAHGESEERGDQEPRPLPEPADGLQQILKRGGHDATRETKGVPPIARESAPALPF